MKPFEISFSFRLLATSPDHADTEPLNLFPSMHHNTDHLQTPPVMTVDENPRACSKDKEDVTVALNIGLPNCSSGSINPDIICNANIAANNYLIPTAEEIHTGFTHFSCHICFKTFNRYNNLQVLLLTL